MSFLFASSHLPAVKRPQDADEEEEPSEARQTAKGSPKGERSESTQAQPMQRSGGVRTISHLEETDSTPESRSPTSARSADSAPPASTLGAPTGALSQRGSQPVGRSLFMTPRPPHPQYFAQMQARRGASNQQLPPAATTAAECAPGPATAPTIRNLQQRSSEEPPAQLLAQPAPAKSGAPPQGAQSAPSSRPARPVSAAPSSPQTPAQGQGLKPPAQKNSATAKNAGIAPQKADSASSPEVNSESKKPNEQGTEKSGALFQKNITIDSSTIPKSQRGLSVLRQFFNPEARNIDELNDSMRKALAGDKALILHVNSNGEHSAIIAIHLDKNGNLVNTLYDPGGTYTGIQNRKGSDDVLTNELPTNGPQNVDWSLADYINYHAGDGSMSFVPIWTGGETARNLDYTPSSMMGFCALSSRDVIQQIPGFTKSWGFRPVTPNDLSDQLHRLMGRKVTIQHKP